MRTSHRHPLALSLLTTLCLLPACGGGGGGTPPPALTAVQPGEATSVGGDLVTLVGSGFGSGVDAVEIGGRAATNVVVQDDGSLTCTVPPGGPGVEDVTVTTPGGSAVLTGGLTYVGPIQGDYARLVFEGQSGWDFRAPPDPALAAWGSTTANGATGMLVSTLVRRVSGEPLGTPSRLQFYSYGEEGRLELERAPGSGGPGLWVGGTSEDAGAPDLILAASADLHPAITLYMDLDGGTDATAVPSLALLAGDYHVVFFLHVGGTFDLESVGWGTLTLDGAGGITNVTLSTNTNGNVNGPDPVPGGTYGVDADRGVTLTLGNLDLAGAFLGGAELIMLGGSTDPTVDTEVMGFLVPQATSATQATFQGAYHMVEFRSLRNGPSMPSDPHFESSLTTSASDGVGELHLGGEFLHNGDGEVEESTLGDVAISYTVSPDGTMELGTSEGPITPDGRFAVLVGGIASSVFGTRPRPALILFLRAP